MAKVTRTGGSKNLEQIPSAPGGPAKTVDLSAKATRDIFQKVSESVLGYKSTQMMSGALKLLGDNVILPKNLTDPRNPANNLKYLRLVSAALGLEDLEKHFYSIEGEEQQEYLAHKTKQREEKWARDEEEKRRESAEKEEASEENAEEEDESDEPEAE